MNKIILILSGIILCLLIGQYVYAQGKRVPQTAIKRFGHVDTNLYRGAQPDEEGFKTLRDQGIMTIINYRVEEDLVARERQIVESLGMHYIHIPWTIFGPYKQEVFDRSFEAIAEKDTAPVFFHCKRGSERTGVIAAAYNIKYRGWSLKEAVKDAEAHDVKFIWKPFVRSKIKTFYKTYLKQTQQPY